MLCYGGEILDNSLFTEFNINYIHGFIIDSFIHSFIYLFRLAIYMFSFLAYLFSHGSLDLANHPCRIPCNNMKSRNILIYINIQYNTITSLHLP